MRLLVFPVMIGVCGLLFSLFAPSPNAWPGRIDAQVGGHRVVVTECYREQTPIVEQLEPTAEGEAAFRFAPCADAVIMLEGDQLTVNGIDYGSVRPGDTIVVHRGRVIVDGMVRAEQTD